MNLRALAHHTLSSPNMREILLSSAHAAMFVQDMQELAKADRSLEEAHAEARRESLISTYGFGPGADRAEKPFIYVDGVAIIPVHGSLINRFNWSWSFVTGYNFLRAQYNAARDDEDVKLIVFDGNSYGGEATGCFEIANEIFEGRGQKPTLGVVDAYCLSACYAIMSACDKLVCTPSGWAGSVGVMSQHVDISKRLEMDGVKYTIIADDPHKADGNPYEPLPDDVKADMKASASKRYGEFIELVARNRQLDSQAIRDLQSRSFRADDALEFGLIDAVQTPAQAVSDFLAELGSEDPHDEEDEEMAQTPAPAAEQANATAAANEQALADARAAGASAERQRVQGIQSCEEAKDRPKLAAHLALNTGLSVEEAKSILGASQAEVASAPQKKEEAAGSGQQEQAAGGGSAFRQAMNNSQNPNVGADHADENEDGVGEGQGLSRAQRAAELAFGKPRKEAAQGRSH